MCTTRAMTWLGRLDDVLGEFDRVLGLSRLAGDSFERQQEPDGQPIRISHEQIGKGSLGLDAIVADHQSSGAAENLPFYLETPNEPEGYAREIALLRGLYKGE